MTIAQRLNERMRPAAGVAAWHLLLGWALLAGLGLDVVPDVERRLAVFDVAPPAPPPPPERPAERDSMDEGESAPPNLRAAPTPVTAPRPERRLRVPPTIPAAPVPGSGRESDSGAADRPGPGTGAGGEGSGTGAGGAETGGGSSGVAVGARLVGGAIRNRDYPPAAARERAGGTVVVRFAVGTDGRARNCRVTRSSGRADLDSTTCRLIEQRFRYAPARDADGRAIETVVGWQQRWWLER